VLSPQGEFVGTINLHDIAEPALQARVKGQAGITDPWAFSVDVPRTSVAADGGIRMHVMMWIPKDGPERHFQVSLRIANSPAGPKARITAISRVRAPAL